MIFNEEEIAYLRSAGQPRTYRPGELIIAEGDHTDHVLVITQGNVKVFSLSRDGYEAVLALRPAGSIVGEFAALDGQPRSASVQAIDEVTAIVISGARFRAFLHAYPSAAVTILCSVVARIREADHRRAEFGPQRVTTRVARLLLELVGDYGAPAVEGPGTTISIPFTQHELAGAIGASREAVARSLRELRERGAVKTERRRITVLCRSLLRDYLTP